jgi:6-pyruvoyltetrahydropterin/6-carboxytetrahydropterin synthase
MSVERYRVRIARDHLLFCSGHFITYDGDHCEPLHGHNYRCEVEIEGGLDENQYLFDFIALTKHAKSITDALDHRMLLPTGNRYLQIEESPGRVRVSCRDREWVFPRSDCVILPVENTTAELLARHIGIHLMEILRREHRFEPPTLRVTVEEGIGHSATWELRQ